MAFLGERGGWTGGEETAEGLCSLLFPGTFPTPDGCQALTDYCAEDAVVPRWGNRSVQGGCNGEFHQRESCTPGDFSKLFQLRECPDPWMQEDLWSLQEGAPGSGAPGPDHRGPEVGLRGALLLTHPPLLSQLAESPGLGAPGCAGPREVTQACSKGLQGDSIDISLGFVLGFFPHPLLSSLKRFCEIGMEFIYDCAFLWGFQTPGSVAPKHGCVLC